VNVTGGRKSATDAEHPPLRRRMNILTPTTRTVMSPGPPHQCAHGGVTAAANALVIAVVETAAGIVVDACGAAEPLGAVTDIHHHRGA